MPTNTLFEIDHIVPRRRWAEYAGRSPAPQRTVLGAGPEHLDNFAWSCPFCNRHKGQQLQGRVGIRRHSLFHPRQQRWAEHFVLAEGGLLILGLSEVGRATERALHLNDARPNGPLVTRYRALSLAGG
jgi:hypothetical protein